MGLTADSRSATWKGPSSMSRSLTVLVTAFLAATLLLTPVVAGAQTPAALPEGALGGQIGWLVETLNGDPAGITGDELEPHFSPELLAQLPADALAQTLAGLATQLAPFEIEADSIVTTRDMPPTNASFVLAGADGVRLSTTVVIDRESGLITGLWFDFAPAPSTPEASPVAGAPTDLDITFESQGDTIYGSLMAPADGASPAPAALIISGSGPTDRDGNSGSLDSMNTNLNLANTLASQGVVSLRYDKLGSGETGFGARSTGEPVNASLFLQEAQDAVAFLASQPSVDPSRIILVGHSEGALFALKLAEQMAAAGTPPAGLILVAPLGIPYLDLLHGQFDDQLAAAVAAGQMSQEDADATMAELEAIIESLRATGDLPAIESAILQSVFGAVNAPFLAEADAWHPAEIAGSLPADLPVLILRGGKDEQVTVEQVQQLVDGFTGAGNDHVTFVQLPDANHLLKVVEGEPNAGLDYANPNLPFDPGAVRAIVAFLETNGVAATPVASLGETHEKSVLAGSS